MSGDHDDCARIFEMWHEYAKARDVENLIELYADDAILETPLVTAILDDRTSGILRGRAEIKHFFERGVERRPDELLKWYRSGIFLTNGKLLTWEYPRATPSGDQIDLVEVMDVENGKIVNHRIYWGWRGFNLLLDNAVAKELKRRS
jgi:SnoaL-like domain